MEEIFNNLYSYIIELVHVSYYGPLFACLLIVIESIIPVLPLFVFITIIFLRFGYFLGFILAYILTIIGCIISYYITRHFTKNTKKFDKLKNRFEKINFSHLVLITALPFSPAFLINILAGLSNIDFKKYFYALLIGKISIVYFWGFIGTSLVQSLTNPKILITILIMLLISYIVSKIVTIKLGIK